MRVLLFLAIVFSLGCDKPDDIAQIRAVVDEIAQRATARDVSGMMDHATSDFVADPGHRDEQAVRPLLVLALRRYGKFDIQYPVPGIELDAPKGTADVSVPFLIVRDGMKFPAAQLETVASDPIAWATRVAALVGDPYQLDLRMTRGADGWMVRRAEIHGFKRIEDL